MTDIWSGIGGVIAGTVLTAAIFVIERKLKKEEKNKDRVVNKQDKAEDEASKAIKDYFVEISAASRWFEWIDGQTLAEDDLRDAKTRREQAFHLYDRARGEVQEPVVIDALIQTDVKLTAIFRGMKLGAVLGDVTEFRLARQNLRQVASSRIHVHL